MTTSSELPTFSNIDFSQVPTELDKRLQHNREKLKQLLANNKVSWEGLLAPIESMDDELQQYWSRINHLNAVVNSDELRKVYNLCLPKLSAYYTEVSHNHDLYLAIQALADSPEFAKLEMAQQKIIHNELRDFKLSGVNLSAEKKAVFAKLVAELNQQHTQFEENLLDASNHWSLLITDKSRLKGIPELALGQAAQRAKEKGQTGWLLNLETPCYLAVMLNADSRELRETLYRAYVTRASDQSDHKQFDNTALIESLLSNRLTLAKLLGFNNYAEKSLATKMADSPEAVLAFLDKLANACEPKAQEEYQALKAFAQMPEGMQAWDVAYFSEKLKQAHFAISEETLRPFFPAPQVINGLFTVVNKLFQITIKPIAGADVWHPDVDCYAVYNDEDQVISYFYLDLYARPKKRDGAWMDECRIRRKLPNGEIQLPIAFITCNFGAPTETEPALLSHDEVITLFHEFGHALQHMLTNIDYAGVSGINGIPWDAVELPSQFLENWAWQWESLQLFAKHYQTGASLPKDLYQKMQQTKNFQSAMQMLRQLEFSLFDMHLHMEFNPDKKNQVQTILNNIREAIAVVKVPDFNRFQNSFAHIFGGGYAAGYYSYKWAEVMACDAFSLFLEKGIFDQESAKRFARCILQAGGSQEPAVLYRQYRGRDPDIHALLTQSGIVP